MQNNMHGITFIIIMTEGLTFIIDSSKIQILVGVTMAVLAAS